MCCCIANVSVNLVSLLQYQSTSSAIIAKSDDSMNVFVCMWGGEGRVTMCLRNETNETTVPTENYCENKVNRKGCCF